VVYTISPLFPRLSGNLVNGVIMPLTCGDAIPEFRPGFLMILWSDEAGQETISLPMPFFGH
jgi:hypothetical protein